jgi:5'-3' exonuclease
MPQLDLFAGPHIEKLAAQSEASISLQMPPESQPDVEPEQPPIVEPAPIEQPSRPKTIDWLPDTVPWSEPPSGDPRVVLIVDVPALLEQAAHVPKVREIIGPNGCPSGIVRSFSKTFLRLLGQHRPDLVAVVFDGQPDAEIELELRMQAEICRTLCELLGCSTIASTKARCIDVIGTLASQCPADWPVIVASNRTILLQLGQRQDLAVTYWRQGEQMTEHADVDCRRRARVEPHQVAAYIALVGLRGVGESSAREIMQAVRTEKALLDLVALGDSFGIAAGLPPKMRGRIRVAQALLEGRDGLATAIRDARLVRDVSDLGEVPTASELEQRLYRRDRDDAGLRLVGETWGIKELRGDYDSE